MLALIFSASCCIADDVKVPLVGCPKDGQLGPEPAPPNGEITISADPLAANKLALYSDMTEYDGLEVLAPRGWHCFGTYGSNGQTLFVAPQELSFDQVLKGTDGPAVQISTANGETSGRFEVAEITSSIYAPVSGDRVTSISPFIYEYETPPGIKGLGTRNHLIPNGTTVKGVVLILHDDGPGVKMLSVRLSQDQSDLATLIIHQTEQ